MTLEERVFKEKFILKLKELNQYRRTNYIKARANLVTKYMVPEQLECMKLTPISDCYLSEIENSYETPFAITTDLYTELAELDKTNHGGLIEEINQYQKEYEKEVKAENDLRKGMDDGQIIERNEKLIEEFKKEFGYDPTQRSVVDNSHNSDGFDVQLSDIEEEEDDDEEDSDQQNTDQQENTDKKKKKSKKESETIVVAPTQVADPNGDLTTLYQLLELAKIDFSQALKDIVVPKEKKTKSKKKKDEENDEETKPKKKSTKSKKKKEEEEQKDEEETEPEDDGTSDKDAKEAQNKLEKEIKEHVDNASKLFDEKLSDKDREAGLTSALQLASYYNDGKVLHKSTIKSNFINIYLVKHFNNLDAMYNLSCALIDGVSIVKNVKSAAKLLKYASDNGHKASADKLKKITKSAPKSDKGRKKKAT